MTLPEDLRRQRRYDDGASIETLMLLDEAADAIETFEARQKTAMQFDDPGGALVWSPAEMVDLLQTMAQSADRRTLSFSEAASIARGAADMIRRLAQPIPPELTNHHQHHDRADDSETACPSRSSAIPWSATLLARTHHGPRQTRADALLHWRPHRPASTPMDKLE